MKTKPYKRQSEARGAVVRFLKQHPFSSANEIHSATGCHIVSLIKHHGMFKNVTRDGVRLWRVVANPEQFIN